MKIKIVSMGRSILHYKDLLNRYIDFDKHYNANEEGELISEHYTGDLLENVEIDSMEELFNMFKEFDEFSYSECQIAIDVNRKIVHIFDHYQE